MAIACTFSGSYYDPAPWTEQVCAGEASVPAGCPITFITGADLTGSDIAVGRIGSNGATTPIASTATLVDTVSQTFTLPDEGCDCTPTPTTIQFHRFSVTVPDATAGDVLVLDNFDGPGTNIQITANAPCGPPQWPSQIDVGLACDRCPRQPTSDGCGAAGAPALAIAGLAIVVVSRRRRQLRPVADNNLKSRPEGIS